MYFLMLPFPLILQFNDQLILADQFYLFRLFCNILIYNLRQVLSSMNSISEREVAMFSFPGIWNAAIAVLIPYEYGFYFMSHNATQTLNIYFVNPKCLELCLHSMLFNSFLQCFLTNTGTAYLLTKTFIQSNAFI